MNTDRFHLPTDAPPELALFVMRTADGTHTGILFRIEGRLVVQDVLWHEQFRSSLCKQLPPHVVPDLDPIEVFRVRQLCNLIHVRHEGGGGAGGRYRIPYAFAPNQARFAPDTGAVDLSGSLGLSCSTFVLTVFASAEIPLVSLEGWPHRDEDKARHESLLERMRVGIPQFGVPPASSEHVARVANEVDCIRVRPEEVAAAGLYQPWPASFDQLEPGGRWILENLPK